jgi:hypothetical protein
LRWCQTSRVKPTSATRDTIKIYRYALVQQGHKPKTIAIKLAAGVGWALPTSQTQAEK